MWGNDKNTLFISKHEGALNKLEEYKKTNYPGDKVIEFNDMVRSVVINSIPDLSFDKTSYNNFVGKDVDYETKKKSVQYFITNSRPKELLQPGSAGHLNLDIKGLNKV